MQSHLREVTNQAPPLVGHHVVTSDVALTEAVLRHSSADVLDGYVEESGMPLLFRESPLNSIWEGSGNVNALDVLRALSREPQVLEAWIVEVGAARGEDPHLDRTVDDTLTLLGDVGSLEISARRLAGQMAACLQGSLLVRFGPPEVASAFCSTRLGTSYSGTFGTLAGSHLSAIVERTTPVVG